MYKLSSEYNLLGSAILEDFQKNFNAGCCARSELKEIFFTFWQSWPYENGIQNLKPEAVWSENHGILRMLPIDIETITLRIAVLPYHPYIILNNTGNEIKLEECVLRHMLKFLSKQLNFKYKLVSPSDELWGSRTKQGIWNGSIGMVTRGEADIVPYLTSTPSRREAVDFSKPIAYVKYGMLVALPSEPPRAFIFLRPYRKEVWLLFVVTAIVLSFILQKIHRWSCRFCRADKKSAKGLSTVFRCLWLIFGAMLNQGGVHLPVTNSARLVLASWWLAVLVIMATFSANLIAFLAFPETRWIVKTLQDLVQHNTIQLVIKEGCPVLEDFQESNLDIYTKIRQTFLENPKRGKVITSSRETITEDVIDGKCVFIDDINFLTGMVDQDYKDVGRCRMTISPHRFSRMDLALGFRRGSSLLPLVNKEIQQMLENGVFAHWLSNVSQHRDECFNFINNFHGQSEITLEDLQGPFYLLAIGLVFGSLFLSCEFIMNKIKIAYKKYTKNKYFNRENSTLHWRYGMQ
uniref:Ionotropic receptor 93a-1 n=1 Tax=Pardosa pseudoannulata TaxID=330961 RepID=A0A7S5HE30_9ARAC|nr:ionotropic receptor 93a-1 [Pardosa pseudoannulata]